MLEARRRLLGEEHPATLRARGNLAATLRDQGKLGRARALGEKVLEAMRRLLGEKHPDTLVAMASLARTLREQGKLGRARTLEARRRRLGQEHRVPRRPPRSWR